MRKLLLSRFLTTKKSIESPGLTLPWEPFTLIAKGVFLVVNKLYEEFFFKYFSGIIVRRK